MIPVTGPVFVGVDDFDHGGPLLELAAREATARDSVLWLAHVYSGFAGPVAPGVAPGFPRDVLPREEAMRRLDAAAAHVTAGHPGLRVETLPLTGPPASALAGAANDRAASLLVVGGRGRGGFAGQLLGSVSLRVLALARCPVLVVRGDPAPDRGRVMLGVDVSEPVSGPDMVAFAFAEAERRGADLYAITAWEDAAMPYLSFDEKIIRRYRDTELSACRARLESALAPWAAAHRGVPAKSEVLPGSPARLLVESTALVDLLVVGGKARDDGDPGMRIGPLTHTVLHHAHCPVVVVPEH